MWYLRPFSKKDKDKVRWEEGVWLGFRKQSGEVWVGTKSGVIKVRDIRRKGSHEERWNRELFMGMKGLPWDMTPEEETEEQEAEGSRTSVETPDFGKQPAPPETMEEDKEMRRLPIYRKDMDKYGYTPGRWRMSWPGNPAATQKIA